MNYKNAFNCKKCPESNSENGCPLWWEMIMTNHLGEQKVEKSCGYQLLPQLLILVCKQSEHTTHAAYSMRNHVVNSVGKVVQAIQHKMALPEEILKIAEPEDQTNETPSN